MLCLKRIQKHATTNDFGQLSFPDNPPTIDFVRSYYGKFSTGKKTGAGVCSTSTTGMASSVLKYFFEENGKRMPDDISTFIKRFKAGNKRKIADLREEGVLPLDEGKPAFEYTNFVQICYQALVNAGDTRFIFCFILLAFNLISRSKQLSNLRYSFISLSLDALVFKFPKSKGDQSGEAGYPKHVYPNPTDAPRCSVVALGMHYFSNLSPSNGRVFQNGLEHGFGRSFTKFLS